jgi:transglutaminase-like putative cysteine protease
MKQIFAFVFWLIALGLNAASPQIIRDDDRFEFYYEVTLPELKGPAQLWLPVAQSGPFQLIDVERTNFPAHTRLLSERATHNNIEYILCDASDSHRKFRVNYRVERIEKYPYAESNPEQSRYLKPDRLVPDDKRFKTIALETVGKQTNAMLRARALYDHVLHRMKYDKTGIGWGRGDAIYACDSGVGNCSDFHSYFIALARSIGIPARFGIGFSIPADKSDGTIDGYHCWAEFLGDGKWIPVDISEAWKHPELAEYYFGHNPANRLEVSVGRDLVVEPLPASGPINFLIYPLLQVDGKEVKVDTRFTFQRLKQ